MQETKTSPKNGSLEAGASVTYSLQTPTGYPILFTMRDDDPRSLLDLMEKTEQSFLDAGYTADIRRGFSRTEKPKDFAEGSCPICGGRLIKFSTKTGKGGVQCEKRKFDFATKQTTGCEYIKWDDEVASSQKTSVRAPQSPTVASGQDASPAQKNLLLKIAPELWREGMSKFEASLAIQQATNK